MGAGSSEAAVDALQDRRSVDVAVLGDAEPACLLRCDVRRQRFQMGRQFFQVSPALQIEADHFVTTQCGAAARPKTDQQAGDDRAIP